MLTSSFWLLNPAWSRVGDLGCRVLETEARQILSLNSVCACLVFNEDLDLSCFTETEQYVLCMFIVFSVLYFPVDGLFQPPSV